MNGGAVKINVIVREYPSDATTGGKKFVTPARCEWVSVISSSALLTCGNKDAIDCREMKPGLDVTDRELQSLHSSYLSTVILLPLVLLIVPVNPGAFGFSEALDPVP